MSKLKIGLVQYSPVWEEPELTIRKIDKLLYSYNLEDIDLLVFPEMSLTGFTSKSHEFAEELDGVSFRYFMELSRNTKTEIFAGLIERYDNDIFNSLIHFDSNGLIRVRYRKIHSFSLAGENKNFSSGDTSTTTRIGKITFGLSICYDLRFPELYRHYGKDRIDILINIANWPIDRIVHWDKLLQARAIENLSYMVGVNRVGNDPNLKYNGHSSVYDPMGNVISFSDKEEVLITEIDLDKVAETRMKLPFLNDIKLI
ncbi:hypothetical protein MNBD_IGNAVI01-251 [hydrothermal vent metagenome]|uniref:CN hydrolase domain-containing protein n=1 Tax=hydrothermal vent metagenome TaxID=652676 RepID=A0A3B1BZC2_9ZZZZ